jgi:hypothetical protein
MQRNAVRIILHYVATFLLGVGFGMGWAHQLTTYSALAGAALVIAGGIMNLVALLLSRK